MELEKKATQDEIDKALYGRRRGGRIRVKSDPADRFADGIVFDSAREMRRYVQLKILERAGYVTGLRLQVPYPHIVNGIKVFTWFADFVYNGVDGKEVVEDSKGWSTEVYKIKKKCIEAEYGIRILET